MATETTPTPTDKKDKKDDTKLNQEIKDEKLCEKIVNVLGSDGPQKVLLAGEAGIGKTRLAKMVGKYAIDHRACFLTLCLHLNQKFEDEWSLYENIASQLCVYSDFEEIDVDDRDEDEEEEKSENDLLNDLKKKIIKEIQNKDKLLAEIENANNAANINTTGAKEKKTPAEVEENVTSTGYLLLILDDEGNKTSEDKVMKDLGLENFLKEKCLSKDGKRLKIIVTRRERDEEPIKSGGDIKSHDNQSEHGSEEQVETKNDNEIQPVGHTEEKPEPQAVGKSQVTEHDGKGAPPSGGESKVATKPSDGNKLQTTDMSDVLLKSIEESIPEDLFRSLTDWKAGDEELMSNLLKKSKKLPAAIFVLAKSLNQITGRNPGIKDDLEKKMDEVLSADRSDDPSNPILHLAYVLLDTYGPWKNILDCFWHSLDFFKHCGCVYYRDLITQWILEGYFDPVRSVEKAYQDGHAILMELINRGMLKIQENNVVVPEMAMSNLIDPRRRGHLGGSRLIFSRVYAGEKEKGIGKITQIDDMIKTVQAKKGDKLTTTLVSGDRLRRVTPDKYFSKLGDLEVLGLFKPTLDPFLSKIKQLEKLRVLVIRDCDLLGSIEELKHLRELHALEVSGASSLKEIHDDFFKALRELQSLHLSRLQIKSSPPSISELKKLHCLIIRDCPLLEDLPDIQELEQLEVVDISGARGLQTCFDNTKGEKKNKSKNKNFYLLKKLQFLDFSESQIERLPIFQDSAVAEKLHSVTRLLLRDCSKLRRLPSLKPLSGLQILDLSGTTSLVEMLEVCFEDKKELKTLNLSRTNLSELATTIEELSSLTELLLKEATNLETIPDIQKLTNLEVIDVAGSTKLQKIEGSFKDMPFLREVNLSGTNVKDVPELPEKSNIHGLKRITLADGRYFEEENWVKVKEAMSSKTSEEASSSNVKPQEISEKKSEDVVATQPNEPRANDGTEKGDVNEKRLLLVPKGKALYTKKPSVFDSASHPNVMEIGETSKLDEKALANAEFVSFVDITSTRLISIFNKTKSMKGCWLTMCMDIKDLFSGVAEEHLESLETLSITNLPSLKAISFVGSLKKLKNLSLDCCPKIETLFQEMPSSLEVLHIKHCENLKKIVEGGDVSALSELKVEKCPNFKGSSEISDWVMVDPREASPQD